MEHFACAIWCIYGTYTVFESPRRFDENIKNSNTKCSDVEIKQSIGQCTAKKLGIEMMNNKNVGAKRKKTTSQSNTEDLAHLGIDSDNLMPSMNIEDLQEDDVMVQQQSIIKNEAKKIETKKTACI